MSFAIHERRAIKSLAESSAAVHLKMIALLPQMLILSTVLTFFKLNNEKCSRKEDSDKTTAVYRRYNSFEE